MKFQYIFVYHLQDFRYVWAVFEKSLILKEQRDILSYLLVRIEERVKRLRPVASQLCIVSA